MALSTVNSYSYKYKFSEKLTHEKTFSDRLIYMNGDVIAVNNVSRNDTLTKTP